MPNPNSLSERTVAKATSAPLADYNEVLLRHNVKQKQLSPLQNYKETIEPNVNLSRKF